MIGLCAIMFKMTLVIDQARRGGVPYPDAQRTAMANTPRLFRKVAQNVAWYVYYANADSSLSSVELATGVERSCEMTGGEMSP